MRMKAIMSSIGKALELLGIAVENTVGVVGGVVIVLGVILVLGVALVVAALLSIDKLTHWVR